MTTKFRARLLAVTLVLASGTLLGTNNQAKSSGANKMDLTGRWDAACHKALKGTFVEESYTFGANNTFRRDQRRFTDQDCAIDAVSELRSYEGTYLIVADAKSVDPNAKKIDFVVNGVFDTALGEAALKKYSDSKYCKLTDWKRGERRSVTGLLCSGETIPAGTVIYDLVLRQDNKLHFGAGSYFRDVAQRKNRPTSIDKSIAFVKSSALSE